MQNSSEIHETWHAIMDWNQHVVVKVLSHLGQVWGYASHKPELLTQPHGSKRERVTFVCETIYAASPLILFTEAT